MYYLRSRYYHPRLVKFLNTDAIVGLVYNLAGSNTYCYCENNPVISNDPSGLFCSWAILIGIAVLQTVITTAIVIKKRPNSGKRKPVVQVDAIDKNKNIPPDIKIPKYSLEDYNRISGKYRELFDGLVNSLYASYNHQYRYGDFFSSTLGQ